MNKILLYFLLMNINFISGLFCTSLEKYQISKIQGLEDIIPAVVIGGGVAGITAALSLIQEGVSCVLIGGSKPGGSLIQSQLVRNWPGKIGHSGIKIMTEMWQHAYKMHIPILEKEVVIAVDFSIWPYLITTKNFESGKIAEYRTMSCIVATGAEINLLNLPGEENYWGKGVSFCVWCDGPLYYGSKVVIVGGGRSALFKAKFMANIASEVLVVVRKDQFSLTDNEDIDQLAQKKNVKVLFNTEIKEFRGDEDFLTDIVLENNKTNERWKEEVDGVFLSIGWKANTKVFENQLQLNSQGAIVLRDDQSTSIMGVFAAGEVCQLRYLQAIVAAGQGCVAALQAKDFLQKVGVFEPKLKSWWDMGLSDDLQSPISEIQSMQEFKTLVVDQNFPIVLNFYSPWCSLCKNMFPILEESAELFKDKITFFKINTGGSTIPNELVEMINGKPIRGVPCLLFIQKGKEIGRFQGACTRDEFSLKLKDHFNV